MAKKAGVSQVDSVQKLMDIINTKFKKKIATSLDDAGCANVKRFVSSGSAVLDMLATNRINSGCFPEGRISTIEGQEQTGKTLVAAHACADVLRRDGTVIYIDKEHAVDRNFFKRVGVDTSKMIYVDDLEYMEEVMDFVEQVAVAHRNIEPNDLFAVVWDSVAATPTKAEVNGEYDDKYYAECAKVLAQSLRKLTKVVEDNKVTMIAINQLKTKIPRPGERVFGEQLKAYGGAALPFHASLRIRLKNCGTIKDKYDNILGTQTDAKIIKSKFGPSHRSCILKIYYSHGVDDSDSWFDILKKYEKITKPNATCFGCPELLGEEEFQTKQWNEHIKDPEFRKKVIELLEKTIVIDYDKIDVGELVVSNIDPDSLDEVEAARNILKEGV